MKGTVIIAAFVALIWASPANAHLAYEAKGKTLTQRAESQRLNLAHAKYVCNHGANEHKRWSCKAVSWLTTEYNQTREAMRPRVSVSGYAPLCGRACVSCESGHDPNAWNGDDYWGWYQFDYDTWKRHGGIPSHWGNPNTSAAEQTAIASRVKYDAWPNC